ncbi:MAG: Gfo/Idh/MocA family protein [Opitutales bacterium]
MTSISSQPFRFAVVGCGGPGKHHATGATYLTDDYTLCAGCDLNQAALKDFGEHFPQARLYTDLEAMLREETPEVVAIATGAVPRGKLIRALAQSGCVKGIFAEKPITVGYGEAKAAVEVCRQNGVALVVNHQRRMLPIFVKFRALLDAGVIGEPEHIVASTPGDLLSDATHLVDCIRHLLHDRPAQWVFGQIYRDMAEFRKRAEKGQMPEKADGTRFGHLVESGATALIEFEGQVRASLQTGSFWQPVRHGYTHVEVHGTKGVLKRVGDQGYEASITKAALYLLNDDAPGWQPIHLENAMGYPEVRGLGRPECYGPFAKTIREGAPHPLSGDNALQTHELVMAIYESARLRQKVPLPLTQDAFPLDLMAESGQL